MIYKAPSSSWYILSDSLVHLVLFGYLEKKEVGVRYIKVESTGCWVTGVVAQVRKAEEYEDAARGPVEPAGAIVKVASA